MKQAKGIAKGVSNDRAPATLDEFEAKQLLASYGVPVVSEERVLTPAAALEAAQRIGYPVAVKGCGTAFAHKTELGLVRLQLGDADRVERAAREVLAAMQGRGSLLVQRMATGRREFLAGMTRDAQFGPVVTFGLGGIFAEALADVVLRLAPLAPGQARDMVGEIRARALLGPVRGMPPVDIDAVAQVLVALSRLALDRPDIQAIDINPLVIEGAQPLAVDALIVLATP